MSSPRRQAISGAAAGSGTGPVIAHVTLTGDDAGPIDVEPKS